MSPIALPHDAKAGPTKPEIRAVVEDRSAREHAEKELDGHLEGPIDGLAEAESLAERAIQRLHLQGEHVVDGLGEAHDTLHETFSVEE
jgi:hypothetical protein